MRIVCTFLCVTAVGMARQLSSMRCSSSLLTESDKPLFLSLRGGGATLTDDEKPLYALGCNVGRQVGDLDCFSPSEIDTILMGVKDTLVHADLQVDLQEQLPKVAALFKERQEAHIAKIEAAGKEALATAAAEDGAVTTASGLVIKTLQEGDGETPGAADTVRVHYTGTLPDGSTFDSSVKRGEPVEFALTDVVKGWQEGIQMMKVGGKAKLVVPPELGYGDSGKAIIPPKATLIFEVELLAVLAKVGAGADAGTSAEEDDDVQI